ncbi:uncharacterized protein GGS25DRAFT_482254 [Hypoxylon fragiforme]|uniref:uncharacterized protein n=1 Tax=Hypoxylon fragiforme TaxID=63214 RepID=UPI0020C5FD4E|nr:uncharacterized protein GGS25DRAFT_482254 [Hypoxylon fragiforme]KAI2611306.1 hypothetical protein GGS25DRAFT_482254 [Hypoxylon fragiforme]
MPPNLTTTSQPQTTTMDPSPYPYPLPPGVHAIPPSELDLRPDTFIDAAITHPPPVTSAKNIWFFWHSGYLAMHAYTRRNIRAWHRRFSPHGWAVRVLDLVPGSASHVYRFLDPSTPITSTSTSTSTSATPTFPTAFTTSTLSGPYAPQHTSDLVRFPLLLRHGGVYADVGLLQIGDLDLLWRTTVGDPSSPYEVLSYNIGGVGGRNLTNYFLGALPGNPFFERCHRLLVALWEGVGDGDGDGEKKGKPKTSTEGMHRNPLLRGVPLMGGTFTMLVETDDGEEEQ